MLIFKKRSRPMIRRLLALMLPIITSQAAIVGMNFFDTAMSGKYGALYNMKHVYFVPFGQDDWTKKPNSLISHVELIPQSIQAALHGKQLQPVLRAYQ